MNYEQFHNALRVLRSIDRDEIPWVLTDEDWKAFLRDPYTWFILAFHEDSRTLFRLMERRMGLTTSAPTTWDTSSSISPPFPEG